MYGYVKPKCDYLNGAQNTLHTDAKIMFICTYACMYIPVVKKNSLLP